MDLILVTKYGMIAQCKLAGKMRQVMIGSWEEMEAKNMIKYIQKESWKMLLLTLFINTAKQQILEFK